MHFGMERTLLLGGMERTLWHGGMEGTLVHGGMACLLFIMLLLQGGFTDDFPLSKNQVFRVDFEDDDIDDSLLDDLFENLPEPNINPPVSPVIHEFTVTSRTPHSFISFTFPLRPIYSLLGGRNAHGPISTVGILPLFPTYSHGIITRFAGAPLAPFPAFMTRGNGITFSTLSGRSVYTCTPGYPVLSKFGTTYIPGSCNAYSFQTRDWTSTGGQMRTYRQGGSMLKLGNYLLAFGGVSYPSNQPISSVEVLDLRRTGKGWDTVPQWETAMASRDQCTVVTKDPKLGTVVLVMGGEGSYKSVHQLSVATNTWSSIEPMLEPRSHHACKSITINNRPGVVVSGGSNRQNHNLTSVEFYDLSTGHWINLPSLARGRRGHAMTSVAGQLAVLGGSTIGSQGQQEFLSDVEMFTGKDWRGSNLEMDQPRDGGDIVKIPTDLLDHKV